MPIKNFFFDRDGVINEVVMRNSLVGSPRTMDEFVVRDEFCEFFDELRKLTAFRAFVISNQPDVSRGLLQSTSLDAMTAALAERFGFDEIVYCEHDDHHGCSCRKPKPGMITELLCRHGLKPEESVLIGDSHKDVLAGQAAGVQTILLRRDYNRQSDCRPEFIVDSLREILGIITF